MPDSVMPVISVIIPIFKNEDTVSRCLDSILAQTYQCFEIIVVNDGSVDDGRVVVSRYAEDDSRIRIIDQVNSGLGAARNTGIRNARGMYISCIDSDDWVKETMFEDLLTAIEQCEADMAVCQADNLLYEKGALKKNLGAFIIPGQELCVTGKEAAQVQLSCEVPILFNSVCFKLIKRELFFKNDIWFPENFRYGEDTFPSVKLFLNADRIAYVRKNLYEYIHESESLTTSYSEKKACDIYLTGTEIIDYVDRNAPDIRVDNFILGLIFPIEKQLVRSGEPASDRAQLLREAVKRWRSHYRPDFAGRSIPFAQRVKIQVAYHNLSVPICSLLQAFRWIPYVKHMT